MRNKIEGKTLLTAQSFEEFVQMSDRMTKACEANGDHSVANRAQSSAFHGDTKNAAQMVDRCYDGYGVKGLSEALEELKKGFELYEADEYLSNSGDELDVLQYMLGEAKCFWREDVENASPNVHLVYPPCTAGSVNSAKYMNHGAAVSLLAEIIGMNTPTKITGYIAGENVGFGNVLNLIEMKDYNEATDLPRIGAATHPSFLRRLWFGLYEQTPVNIVSELYPERSNKFIAGKGYARTDSQRREVLSDDSFFEWCRIDADEMVVDIPSPAHTAFNTMQSTIEWVRDSLAKIQAASEDGRMSVKLY
jgi:hypothetical protein